MEKLGRGIDTINEVFGKFASYFVLVIMFVVIYHVIARYVFGSPTFWAWDTSRYLFGVIMFFGAGYHVLHRQIITVDVFYVRFPTKMQAFVCVLSLILTMIFCIAVIHTGFKFAMRSIEVREIASQSAWGPPIYPLKALVPFGAFLFLIQAIRQHVTDFISIIKGKGVEGRSA